MVTTTISNLTMIYLWRFDGSFLFGWVVVNFRRMISNTVATPLPSPLLLLSLLWHTLSYVHLHPPPPTTGRQAPVAACPEGGVRGGDGTRQEPLQEILREASLHQPALRPLLWWVILPRIALSKRSTCYVYFNYIA